MNMEKAQKARLEQWGSWLIDVSEYRMEAHLPPRLALPRYYLTSLICSLKGEDSINMQRTLVIKETNKGQVETLSPLGSYLLHFSPWIQV